jgi:hypothetical protein
MPCKTFYEIEVALLEHRLVHLFVMLDVKLGSLGAIDFGTCSVSLFYKRLREMVFHNEFRNVEVFSDVTHSISHLL